MTRVTTDPISDMLARIRNAMAVNKTVVVLPHSKIKQSVAEIMRDNGFLSKVDVEKQPVGSNLVIRINDEMSPASITELNRISRPGRRTYVNADSIPVVRRGRGIVILSTSKGIMTGDSAKKQRLGGELLAEVY